jgi:hypothetical protein
MTTLEIKSSLKNPRYNAPFPSNDVLFDAIFNGRNVTFLACSRDIIEEGRNIHKDAIIGKYGEIAPYVPRPPKENSSNIVNAANMIDIITDFKNQISDLREEIAELKKAK